MPYFCFQVQHKMATFLFSAHYFYFTFKTLGALNFDVLHFTFGFNFKQKRGVKREKKCTISLENCLLQKNECVRECRFTQKKYPLFKMWDNHQSSTLVKNKESSLKFNCKTIIQLLNYYYSIHSKHIKVIFALLFILLSFADIASLKLKLLNLLNCFQKNKKFLVH